MRHLAHPQHDADLYRPKAKGAHTRRRVPQVKGAVTAGGKTDLATITLRSAVVSHGNEGSREMSRRPSAAHRLLILKASSVDGYQAFADAVTALVHDVATLRDHTSQGAGR